MKLASGIAPVPEMLTQGITWVWAQMDVPSNNNLDLFTEMDMAAKLHKIPKHGPTVLERVTVLRMATIEERRGLWGLKISPDPGNREKSRYHIVDTNKPHLTPMYNPYSHLVYSARGSDVSHSIINGQIVMEDRKLLTMDLEEIMARAREKAALVREWVRIDSWLFIDMTNG